MFAWCRRNLWKTTVGATLAATVIWLVWPASESLPAVSSTVPVTLGDVEKTVPALGSLEAGYSVEVGAQVSGQLKKLHVRLGDVVSEGDLLGEIDDLIQGTRVASAEASLESLEANSAYVRANVELAQGQLRRQQRLMQAQATTEVEYDHAVVALIGAEANLKRHVLQIKQARASLEEAIALLEFTRITAPVAGTIISVLVEEGQTLNASQATPKILRIGNLNRIRVIAQIPEVDVGRLTPGMEAYFSTISGRERRWNTRLQEISPLPASASGTSNLTHFEGLLEINNADRTLFPGMSVKVFFLERAVRQVHKVPLSALTFVRESRLRRTSENPAVRSTPDAKSSANGLAHRPMARELPVVSSARRPEKPFHLPASQRSATVQVVGPDGEVVSRLVQVGIDNGVEAEVISGLQEGETLVAGIGQTRLPD